MWESMAQPSQRDIHTRGGQLPSAAGRATPVMLPCCKITPFCSSLGLPPSSIAAYDDLQHQPREQSRRWTIQLATPIASCTTVAGSRRRVLNLYCCICNGITKDCIHLLAPSHFVTAETCLSDVLARHPFNAKTQSRHLGPASRDLPKASPRKESCCLNRSLPCL